MKIWLCKHSEPLPLEKNSRKFRMGMLSDALKANGHEVIWWTSTFDHVKKEKLKIVTELPNKTQVIMLDGITYKKNVSIKRIINHSQIGKKFSLFAEKKDKPDVIFVSMPTLDFAYRAVKYAKKYNIPVVVDIRDLWPDVFLDLIPFSVLRKEIFLTPWNKKLKWTLSNADYITAITEEYLKWALEKGNLSFNEERHKVFPLGYKHEDIVTENPFDNNNLQITFAGTIGYHFDLETVFKAAKILQEEKVQFNIIGDGDLLKKYQSAYSNVRTIKFWGWKSGEELAALLKYSDIGIAPYNNTRNFVKNIPNKPYEYMANGLPILTCLKGATRTLIQKFDIGYFYESNNPEQLAFTIKKILENPNEIEHKKYKSKKTFEKYFDANKIYLKLAEFLWSISLENGKNIIQH
jgi:glycosyltransferase involved in cell wall biosynthesis